MTYFAVRDFRQGPRMRSTITATGKGREQITALAETALLFVLSGVVIWRAVARLTDGRGQNAVEATSGRFR